MSASRFSVVASLLLTLALPAAWVIAQTRPKAPVRRAEPPKFTKNDPFFKDAFAELDGERPVDLGKAAPVRPMTAGNTNTPTSNNDSGSAGTGSGWAALIGSTTLEDEIKAQKLAADKTITTPSDFAGNGYKLVRRDFSIVAMVFAVIAEYDGDVRWKKEAASERDQFARTAANAKVGTTGVYNEAKLRRQDLADLIGGQAIEVKEAETQAKWGEIVNRSPLMQRLEAGRDEKIKPWSANAGEFKGNAEDLMHEAQIFAVIGEVLKKDGMEDGDDAEYEKFADMLVQGGKDLAAACKDNNFDAASKASVLIINSCEKCHESYR